MVHLMDQPYRMRAVVVPLDPTPFQAQLMRSYCGASRFAYNWAIATAKDNLDTRKNERREGFDETELTMSLSWSAWSMTPLWNSVKDEVAPWHRDVTKHAFRCGVTNASAALKNYHESKKGVRKGRPVRFPKFKNRYSKPSVTFTETGMQNGWFADNSRHVRLILPRFAVDPRITRRREQLRWLHTTESLHRLKKKVESGEWTIQSVTISFTGGCWQASFSVRQFVIPAPNAIRLIGSCGGYLSDQVESGEWTIQSVTISFTGGRWQASFSVRQFVIPAPNAIRLIGPFVGVDVGVKYLATLSVPVRDLSDEHGHIENPRHLDAELIRLAKLDRIGRAS